jgi:hypothetical protein
MKTVDEKFGCDIQFRRVWRGFLTACSLDAAKEGKPVGPNQVSGMVSSPPPPRSNIKFNRDKLEFFSLDSVNNFSGGRPATRGCVVVFGADFRRLFLESFSKLTGFWEGLDSILVLIMSRGIWFGVSLKARGTGMT